MRPRRRVLLLAALATITAGGPPSGSASAAAAIVVPLHVVSGAVGDDRLGIDVTIGGTTVRVLFDTGSAGLRILATAVPANAVRRTGRAAAGSFANGLILRGGEATATLAIGAVRSAGEQPIELVDGYSCGFLSPFCPSIGGGAPEMFGGLFPGILGVRNRVPVDGVCCANPMPGLANAVGERFTVHANLESPTLTLDPDPAWVDAAFTLLDVPAGTSPRGCIRVDVAPKHEVCGEVVFDTGAPQVTATTTTDNAEFFRLGSATNVTLTVGTWSHVFPIGGPEHLRVTVIPAGADRIVVGLTALQHVDVYYDLAGGRIGLRSR